MADKAQAETIFGNAIEIGSVEERNAFLNEACHGDLALRHEVEKLVQDYFRAGAFLEQPVAHIASPTIDQPISEQPGDTIGPYRLLQQIGEGGMGVVYMAEQSEPVERRVSLKVIKPGMDTRKVIARFEAERQALAMMDHPNIAKVLDAGTTDSGRPYFVMELVKGVPVTQYCDKKQLTPRERLELFVPICQAVQHAHQKGIIHRDIKPSNVLVAQYDDRPAPKIIDFGVAKAIEQRLNEKTMFTEFGQVVGTVEYMSPEQAELNQLDVDTRSDVYSLGVLLYELLTGETPFDRKRLRSAAFDELLRIIREEEPPRPSLRLSTSESLPSIAANRHVEHKKLSALVHGELDWIVMKALEKDRTRRYETASRFAEDVQHYLNDEPVTACPPSASYRFRKFARRNKSLIATVAAIAAAVFAGIVGTTWQALRATNERNRAVAAEEEAGEEARRADLAAEVAKTEATRANTEAATAKAINDFLQDDLLGMAGAKAQAEARLSPDPSIKLRTIVDRAADNVGNRFADQPQVEAVIRRVLGKAYYALGDYENGEEHLRRAVELSTQAFGPEHATTRLCMTSLGLNLAAQRRDQEAEELHQELLATQKRILGVEHSDTLLSMSNLALDRLHQGRHDEAEQLLRQGLEIAQRVRGPEHPDSLTLLSNLGLALTEQGRHSEAEALFRQALLSRKRLSGEEHPATLFLTGNLAMSLDAQRRWAEANSLYHELLALMQRVLGPEHPDTLRSKVNLAANLTAQGKPHEAEKLHRETLPQLERSLGVEHPLTLLCMNNLAYTLFVQNRFAAAEQLYRQAFEVKKRVSGADSAETMIAMESLACCAFHQGRFEEAVELRRQILEPLTEVLGPDHVDTRRTRDNLRISCEAGAWMFANSPNPKHRDVEASLRCARSGVEFFPSSANAWDNLGVALYRNRLWNEAAEALEKARAMRGGNNPEHAFFLAMTYQQLDRRSEAIDVYGQSLCWLLGGHMSGEQHRFWEEAEQALGLTPTELAALVQKTSGAIDAAPSEPGLLVARGSLLARLREWDDAAADWAEAIDRLADNPRWISPRKTACRELASLPEVFQRVTELRPKERVLWVGRGQHFALRSRWAESAKAYENGIQSRPISDATFEYAGTALLAGDTDGYLRLCRELRAQAERGEDPFVSFIAARTAGLGKIDDAAEPRHLITWAASYVDEDASPWALNVLGLAHYRAGEYDQAIEQLDRSNAANWGPISKAQNGLILALAHQGAGRHDEAQRWLESARMEMDRAQPQSPDEPAEAPVPDWIELEVLRREAEALVGSRADAATTQEGASDETVDQPSTVKAADE